MTVEGLQRGKEIQARLEDFKTIIEYYNTIKTEINKFTKEKPNSIIIGMRSIIIDEEDKPFLLDLIDSKIDRMLDQVSQLNHEFKNLI